MSADIRALRIECCSAEPLADTTVTSVVQFVVAQLQVPVTQRCFVFHYRCVEPQQCVYRLLLVLPGWSAAVSIQLLPDDGLAQYRCADCPAFRLDVGLTPAWPDEYLHRFACHARTDGSDRFHPLPTAAGFSTADLQVDSLEELIRCAVSTPPATWPANGVLAFQWLLPDATPGASPRQSGHEPSSRPPALVASLSPLYCQPRLLLGLIVPYIERKKQRPKTCYRPLLVRDADALVAFLSVLPLEERCYAVRIEAQDAARFAADLEFDWPLAQAQFERQHSRAGTFSEIAVALLDAAVRVLRWCFQQEYGIDVASRWQSSLAMFSSCLPDRKISFHADVVFPRWWDDQCGFMHHVETIIDAA